MFRCTILTADLVPCMTGNWTTTDTLSLLSHSPPPLFFLLPFIYFLQLWKADNAIKALDQIICSFQVSCCKYAGNSQVNRLGIWLTGDHEREHGMFYNNVFTISSQHLYLKQPMELMFILFRQTYKYPYQYFYVCPSGTNLSFKSLSGKMAQGKEDLASLPISNLAVAHFCFEEQVLGTPFTELPATFWSKESLTETLESAC